MPAATIASLRASRNLCKGLLERRYLALCWFDMIVHSAQSPSCERKYALPQQLLRALGEPKSQVRARGGDGSSASPFAANATAGVFAPAGTSAAAEGSLGQAHLAQARHDDEDKEEETKPTLSVVELYRELLRRVVGLQDHPEDENLFVASW